MARKSRKETLYRTSRVITAEKGCIYKAGLYGRVSVESLEKMARDTVGTQMAFLRDYVGTLSDVVAEREYVDDDITGTDFERPAFGEMMEDIRRGEINCVVVKDLSRFGREHILTGEYLEKIFPDLGVRFIAVNDNIDTLDGDGGVIVPFMNYINERYAKDASVKIKSHFKAMQMTGAFCSSFVPYGYIRSGEDKHEFVPDAETAGVVQDIFAWFVEGVSRREIVRRLEGRGVLSPAQLLYHRGIYKLDKYRDMKWGKRAVTRIVQSQVYCGDMVQNKSESDFERSGKKGSYVVHDQEEWIVVRNTHESLVSRETYARAQERLVKLAQEHKEECEKRRQEEKPDYILSGILKCGHCGSSINVKRHTVKGGVHYWYICPTHEAYGVERCPKTAIDMELAHELVLVTLKRFMDNFVDVQAAVKRLNSTDDIRRKRQELQKQIRGEEAGLSRARLMKSRLYMDLSEGLIDEMDYSYLSEQYGMQIGEGRERIERLKKQAEMYAEEYREGAGIRRTVGQFLDCEELNREMVDAFVERIIVDNEGTFQMELKCRDEYDALMANWLRREGVGRYA